MTFKSQISNLYDIVFTKLEKEWSFEPLIEPLLTSKEITVVLSTTQRKYLIRLRKGKYYILSFKRADKIMELDWNEKGKYKNAEELYSALNGFFVYLEDYDHSLKRRS